MDSFPIEVAERLKWYVYRLIDPRNGETFYVGKGQGDRIFQHAKAAVATRDDDEIDLKFQRIQHIMAAGLEVAHIVHRHGIENENLAFQIEAALIDAYPGLANKVTGHGSGDYGVRHVREIIAEYKAEPFEAREPLILISISRSFDDEGRSIYDAVRGCWKINAKKAMSFGLVLAHRHGIVLGVFRPKRWVPATTSHFPWLTEDVAGRFGFVGEPAEPEVSAIYFQKRVPDVYRAKGAANPIRFIEPKTRFG